MKSILISIRPEWVAKILNGEKTIEIRKTMPKCELPCKVYIYETESGGKVVAEFTLNKITKHEKNYIDVEDNLCYNFSSEDVKKAGFYFDDKNIIASIFVLCEFDLFINDYGKGKPLYAWHIDDLKVYDKPKELCNFLTQGYRNYDDWLYGEYNGTQSYNDYLELKDKIVVFADYGFSKYKNYELLNCEECYENNPQLRMKDIFTGGEC